MGLALEARLSENEGMICSALSMSRARSGAEVREASANGIEWFLQA